MTFGKTALRCWLPAAALLLALLCARRLLRPLAVGVVTALVLALATVALRRRVAVPAPASAA